MLPVFDIKISSRLFFWYQNSLQLFMHVNYFDIHIMIQADIKDSSFYSTSFHTVEKKREGWWWHQEQRNEGGRSSFSVISIPDRNFPLLLLKFFLKGWDSKQRCGKQYLSKIFCIRNNPWAQALAFCNISLRKCLAGKAYFASSSKLLRLEQQKRKITVFLLLK